MHRGHVRLAQCCARSATLDKLLIVPTGTPPHKQADDMPDNAHRIAMLELAFADCELAQISRIEMQRTGKSYTLDTLLALRTLHPEDALYLIMGSDMFYTLESWHRAEEIRQLVTVLTMPREPGELSQLMAHGEHLTKAGWQVQVCAERAYTASSTQVRAGQTEALPDEVADYIAQNGLYGQDADAYPWDYAAYEALARQMLSPRRFEHSLNVADRAVELAARHGVRQNLCRVAGLLHDLCKEMPYQRQLQIIENSATMCDKTFLSQPQIWHGYTAAAMLPDALNIRSRPILNAVRFHTTARRHDRYRDGSYLADLTSQDRHYPDVEVLRALSDRSLQEGMVYALSYFRGSLKEVCEQTRQAFAYYLA